MFVTSYEIRLLPLFRHTCRFSPRSFIFIPLFLSALLSNCPCPFLQLCSVFFLSLPLSQWFNTLCFIGMSVTLAVFPNWPAIIGHPFCHSFFFFFFMSSSLNGSVFLSAALPSLTSFKIWHSIRRLSSCNTCSTMDSLWANTSQGE